jgi:large subunit ribosomal protein L25
LPVPVPGHHAQELLAMDVSLTAELGRTTGSRPSKRLRREGKVPAVVYGMGNEPTSITVDWKELRRVLTTEAGLNALIDLHVGADANLTVIKDMQRDPVRRNVTHVDFMMIDRNVAMDFDIPVVVVGDMSKLEHEKGMADQLLYTLTVKAKPGAIANQIDVDASDLGIGDQIKVGDLDLGDGVETEVDPETVIVHGVVTRQAMEGDESGEGEDGEGAEGDSADGASDDGAESDSES